MALQPLKLYTTRTANNYKVTVLLEFLGLIYDTQTIDILAGEQKEEWYLKMNPNGRIPTLVDPNTDTTLSESAAILTYLADTYDKDREYSYEVGTPEYYKQLEFLYFQMAGIGPMQGQAVHFAIFAPEKIPYGIERYAAETKRLYGVFDEYLKRNEANGPYAVGTHYSLADFATIGWALYLQALKIDISQWPHVHRWYQELFKIPQIRKAFSIPALPMVPLPE